MGVFSSWVVVSCLLLLVVLILLPPRSTAEDFGAQQTESAAVGSSHDDLPSGSSVTTPTPSEEEQHLIPGLGLEKGDANSESTSDPLLGNAKQDSENSSGSLLLGKALETAGYSFCHVWQDFRLLISALLGFLLTHFVSISIGPSHPHGTGLSTRESRSSTMGGFFAGNDRRFKLYCYAM